MKNPFKKYSCVKQHDTKDCGAACLATISKTHGLKYPISKIREVAGTDKKGTSALGIVQAAEELNFIAKGVKVKQPEDLFGEIPLPAIAHVIIDNSLLHYVVIHKVTKKEIIIADPAQGIVKYSPKDFFEIWTGILILMVPNVNFQKGNETEGNFKRFFNLIKPHKSLLTNVFLSSILITILGIAGSFYFKILLDDIIPNNLTQSLNTYSIGFIVLMIFKVLTDGLRNQLFIHLGQKLDIPLMLGYYNHVIKLPMNFFDTREVGEIISRFNDASKIREAISGVTLTMMIDTLMILLGGLILYLQSPLLFSLTLVPLIFYAIIVFSFKNSIENINRKTMESNANLTSYLVQSLNGVETIKAYNAESEVSEETEQRFIKFIKNIFKNESINNMQITLKSFVKGIFSIVILWIGTSQALSGRISFGELLTFNALLVYFLDPIENIINLQASVQSALVAADRLSETMDLSLEKPSHDQKKIIPETIRGDIEIKGLDFRYGKRSLILKKINMNIEQGSRVALIGESGSGKTTLVKLLMKFYEYENGDIIINDYNLKDINIESIREKIAYISQDTFLFNGTIYENIKLGNPGATYEDVIAACKKAQIHKYINTLPLRYDTLIEENGSNFSGGQKQRLSIARAVLTSPDVFIMDEATSNLDSMTKKAIEKTLNDFSKDITTIVIAHDLSNMHQYDTIYVLEEGKLIEQGSHEELKKLERKYFELWKEQQSNAGEQDSVLISGGLINET